MMSNASEAIFMCVQMRERRVPFAADIENFSSYLFTFFIFLLVSSFTSFSPFLFCFPILLHFFPYFFRLHFDLSHFTCFVVVVVATIPFVGQIDWLISLTICSMFQVTHRPFYLIRSIYFKLHTL